MVARPKVSFSSAYSVPPGRKNPRSISRIAAVHVAREEKVSIRSALKFSFNKFLSFLFAPIIPLMIILVVGIVLAIGSLLLEGTDVRLAGQDTRRRRS